MGVHDLRRWVGTTVPRRERALCLRYHNRCDEGNASGQHPAASPGAPVVCTTYYFRILLVSAVPNHCYAQAGVRRGEFAACMCSRANSTAAWALHGRPRPDVSGQSNFGHVVVLTSVAVSSTNTKPFAGADSRSGGMGSRGGNRETPRSDQLRLIFCQVRDFHY